MTSGSDTKRIIKRWIGVVLLLSFLLSNNAFADDTLTAIAIIDKEIAKGNYEPSAERLTAIIDQQKKNLARFYQQRAQCYENLQRFDEAIRDYKEVLAYSVNGRIEFAIGKCLYQQRKFHDALEMFEKADSLKSPNDTNHAKYLFESYRYLALYATGKFDEAMEGLRELKSKYPDEDVDSILKGLEAQRQALKKVPQAIASCKAQSDGQEGSKSVD